MTDLTPEKTIQFTDDDYLRATAKEQLAFGHHCFVVNEAVKDVGNDPTNAVYGVQFIKLMIQVLRDPEDVESGFGPTQYVSIPTPRLHPDAEGATLPSWVNGLCTQGMLALYGDELPSRPFYDKTVKTYFLDGEEITKDEASVAYDKSTCAAMEKVEEVWADLSRLCNFIFYGEVILDKKTGQYRNVRNMQPSLRADATLVPANKAVERTGGTTAPASAAKKKAKKKAAKKRGDKK